MGAMAVVGLVVLVELNTLLDAVKTSVAPTPPRPTSVLLLVVLVVLVERAAKGPASSITTPPRSLLHRKGE